MRTLLIGASFITTFLAITVLSAPAALDPALILYFTFDEQLDGRQVEDMSGGGNNGKLRFGAKITNEPAEVHTGAGALKIFDNVSAQLRVDSFERMDTYKEHTYTFWLYKYELREGANIVNENILEKGNIIEGDAKGHSPAIIWNNPLHSLIYSFRDGDFAEGFLQGVGPGGKGQKIQLKTWYHIAGVKEGGALIIYIDGKDIARSKVKRDFLQGKGHLRIGATDIRASSFAMDEFALYDRALTAKEVALDAKGVFLSVEPQGKLATIWGRLKTGR